MKEPSIKIKSEVIALLELGPKQAKLLDPPLKDERALYLLQLISGIPQLNKRIIKTIK
jgi:hypothetical protein